MKMNRLTILILTLLFSVQSFSQKNPTEKETFDFICYFIENKVIDDIQDNLPIKSFKSDKKNQVVEYESSWVQASGSPNEFRITEKNVIDFKKIKSVDIKSSKDINYTDWSWKGNWRVIVNFKENAIKVYTPKNGVFPPNIIYKDVKWNDREYIIVYRDETAFYFHLKDEEDAKKLYKALNHLVKIKTGIDTSLFDD